MTILRKYFSAILATLLIGLYFVNDNAVVDLAAEYTTDITKDSGAIYLSLRGINAALSFVEEIEVNASVVIASGSVQPFKVLEPIDDAVERMSSAVFHIGVISAALTIVLDVFGRLGFLLLGVALGAQQVSAYLGWVDKSGPIQTALEGVRKSSSVILLALMAFCVSSSLSDRLADAKWVEYQEVLDEITSELEGVSAIDQIQLNDVIAEEAPSISTEEENANDDDEDGSWASWITDPTKRLWDGTMDKGGELVGGVRRITNGSMNSMVEKYNLASDISFKFWERKDQLIDALTAIFALFLFKIFILPILLFLFFYGSLKGVLTRQANQ